jgi:NAD(P)-dependent dehydrogenase (short-subunit alcohol dehydrogenase family)
MKSWSVKDIPSLEGKVYIVTGGNSGIGFEAVQVLASHGAEVIMASRDLTKANQAIEKIKSKHSQARVVALALDLNTFVSIRSFAKKFLSQFSRLDGLLNNAGIMLGPLTMTKDGIESQLGTNHIGHFLLTQLLWPVLKKTPEARVVNVSSIAHRQGSFDFTNMNYERPKSYAPMKAYGRSKLANLLFTYALARRTQDTGLKILAAHPGVSKTNLFARHVPNKKLYNFLFNLIPLQSAYEGALPMLRALLDQEAKNGWYYGPNGWMEMGGKPKVVRSIPLSLNEDVQEQLWKYSEKMIGDSFVV